MAKLILDDIANLFGNPTSAQNTINSNNDTLEAALENTLSRNGLSPNQMTADFDMNGNDILNVGLLDVESLLIDGNPIPSLPELIEISEEVLEARDEATLARDEAVAAAISIQAELDTRAYAIASYHPAFAPNKIRTAGYALVGDGGEALYKRVISEPAHGGKLSIVLLDGITTVWYELVKGEITPAQVGAVGDGVTSDDAAIASVFQLSAIGYPINWGGPEKIYRITTAKAMTATKSISWRSSGATVFLDSPSTIQRTLSLTLDSYDFYMTGVFNLDVNEKAHQGLYVTNTNLSRIPNVRISGINVRNVFRASTGLTGGDGIFIIGGYNLVVVTQFTISRVHMATGAGVQGSQGVTGVTIVRDAGTSADANLIVVSDFSIDSIFSDDNTYTYDQDAVRVFTSYNSVGGTPRDGMAVVMNGFVKNSHGRAVKLQCESATVRSIRIVRDATIYGGGYIGNVDVDCQVAGGTIEDIDCQYTSNFPDRVFAFGVTSSATRVTMPMVVVRNIRVNQLGSGSGIARLGNVISDFAKNVVIKLEDVQVQGSKTHQWLMTFAGSDVAGRFMVFANSIESRCTTAVISRTGSVLIPSYVTGLNISNVGGSVPFAQASTGGDFTASLIGANINVS